MSWSFWGQKSIGNKFCSKISSFLIDAIKKHSPKLFNLKFKICSERFKWSLKFQKDPDDLWNWPWKSKCIKLIFSKNLLLSSKLHLWIHDSEITIALIKIPDGKMPWHHCGIHNGTKMWQVASASVHLRQSHIQKYYSRHQSKFFPTYC